MATPENYNSGNYNSGRHTPQGGCFRLSAADALRAFSPKEWLRCVALDFRSLALFRFLLGLTLIFDLVTRAEYLTAHYTDSGVLPRAPGISDVLDISYFCIHLAFGSWYGEALLFILAGLSAVCLTVGYRTRTATVVCWIFTASLQNRNTLVGDSADTMMRLLLFWAMFLPLGKSYSVDSAYAAGDSRPHREETEECSLFSFTYILQLCVIYWTAFATKHHPVWRSEGLGVFYALHIDAFTLPAGIWLREYSELCKLLSFGTLILESLGPILLFLPYPRPRWRMLAIAGFMSFHAGLGLTIALGTFPGVGIMAWTALLPKELWDYFRVPADTEPRQKLALLECLEKLGFERRPPRLTPPHRPIVSFFRLAFLQLFAACCMLFVVFWNIRALDFNRYSKSLLPTSYNWIGQLFRLDQDWALFAPRPFTEDGWYVIPGTLRNGDIVDLMTSAGVSWEKPANVAERFINQRWRKYLLNLWEQRFASQRLYFARYLCRTWNSMHSGDATLETFTIYYMLERTTPKGAEEPKPISIWNHDCFG